MTRKFKCTATAILASVMTAAAFGASAQDATAPAPADTQAVPPVQQTPTTDPSAAPTTPAQPAVPPVADNAATAAGTTGPKDFIQQAYLANEFGVAAAQVALKTSTDAEVKSAAQTLLTEGTATRQDMIKAIQGSTADMHFDQAWPQDYKQKLADLQSVTGKDFDQKYVELQGAELDKATALFQSYASTATDASTKTFASATLPKLQAQAAALDAAGSTGTAGTR
jgi:predicted outer membrane protein